MSVLVSVTELKLYLGDAPASSDDALLQALLDDVEALFASEAGRQVSEFQDAGTARTEVHDGTGSADLYLDYPINALTSVVLGYDSASPDETLDIADKHVLVYAVEGRRLSRTDGGTFGRAGQPRYVTVVYDFAADLPADAKLAIKSVTSSVYRNRGSEGMKSETVGAFYSYTREDIKAATTDDPFWCAAVNANRRTMLV